MLCHYIKKPIICLSMESSIESSLLESDESDNDTSDKISTTSSRSKDGRFMKTGSKTVHPCPHSDCIKYFTRPSRLQTHLLSHTGEQPFKCTNSGCNKSYSRSAHLKRHMIKCQTSDTGVISTNEKQKGKQVEVLHNCKICPKVFSNKYSLQKHLKVHEDPQRYVCQHCKKSFHKHHFLKSHIALEHEARGKNGKIACSKCDKTFAYESQMKRHFSRHHENLKRYECSVCDDEFDKWTDLRSHISSKHPKPGKNACEVCQKNFSGPSASGNLQEHRASHAATRKVFHCPVLPCSRFYFHEKNLQDHISGYHEGNRFPCTENGCNYRLSSRRKLVQHMKNIHSGNPKKVKSVKSGKERAERMDKGTFKTSMATVLSSVSFKCVEDSSVNRAHNEPTRRKSDKNISKGVNIEMESGLQDDNSLETASPQRIKKMCKEHKSNPYNPLFSQKNGIPVFSLPICKRTQTVIKLVDDAEVVPTLYEKYENYDYSKEKSHKKSTLYPEPKRSGNTQKSLPKISTASKKDKTIDFSKYLFISTSNYK